MHQTRERGLTKKKRHHHLVEWIISKEMMDHALRSVRARTHLDRDHDIPYVAGYSLDGRTIFIDRHMPKSFVFKSRRILTDRFLIMHEAVEKALMQMLGMHYLHAHQIALRAEQAAVRAEGVDWHAYDDFMQEYIKEIGHEKLERVPNTLDLTPYQDFHDDELVQHMRANMVDHIPIVARSDRLIAAVAV
jgi:hypothetical protein